MQTLAAIMEEQGRPAPFALTRPFAIEEITLDAPGPGEVLVEIGAAGLSHSDLTTVEGLRARPLPIVGGHQGAGIVREFGPGVTALSTGDHVVLTAAAGCGNCPSCSGGRPVLCETVPCIRLEGALATGARRFRRHGALINHYSGVPSFSQYTVVAVESAVRIDPPHPLDVAAVFGCAVLTGAAAIFNAARLRPGQSVAVIGLGGDRAGRGRAECGDGGQGSRCGVHPWH